MILNDGKGVKEYLGEVKRLTIVIDSLERSVETLREDIASIQGISYDKDRVQSSASADGMINKMIRLDELASEMENAMIERAKKRAEITTQITLMPNGTYMQLLFKRYVEMQKFEQIALDMCYSYDRIIHIHQEALEAFADKYNIGK